MLLLGEPTPDSDDRGSSGRETGPSTMASATRHKRGKSAPVAGAGTGGAGADFASFGSGNHGASASRASSKLTKSESSGSVVLGGGGKKKKKWSHDLEPGDHVVRWSHIALYPIQIHGIVLQVTEDDDDGDNGGVGSVMLCDFGLTKYGGDNEEDGGGDEGVSATGGEAETEAEAASSTGSVSSSSAAAAPSPSASPVPPTHGHHHHGFRSLTSSSTHRRLNVITLTTRRDIKKWRKVNYGGDGLFSSSDDGGAGKKSKWTAWLPSPKTSGGSTKSIAPDGDDATDATGGSSETTEVVVPRNVEFPVRVGDIGREERHTHPEFLWILSSLEEELVPRDVTPATGAVAVAVETTTGGASDASELLRPFPSDDSGGSSGRKRGELLRGFPPPPPLTAAVQPPPPPPPPPPQAGATTSSPSWGWRSSPSATTAILNSNGGGGGGGGCNNKHGKGVLRKKQRMGFFGSHRQKKRTSKRRSERERSLFPIVVGEDLPEFLAVLTVSDAETLSSSTETTTTTALHEMIDGDEEKTDGGGGGLGYEPYRPSRFERTPSGHLRQIPPSPQTSKTGTTAGTGKPKLPKTDPAKLVLSRVRFLLEHEGEDGRSEVLPPYHVFHSNSECIAVWCKTGRWSTLQAAVFLHSTAVGNAKQMFLAVGGVAALNPLLIPAIAPLGIAYVGAPWLYLNKCKGHWERATASLTDRYWAWAVKDPDVFVEVIHQWSGLR